MVDAESGDVYELGRPTVGVSGVESANWISLVNIK